jgi:hypothetical protein
MAKLLEAPEPAIDPFHFGSQMASDQIIGNLVELGRVGKWKCDIAVNLSNGFMVSVNAV